MMKMKGSGSPIEDSVLAPTMVSPEKTEPSSALTTWWVGNRRTGG